MDADIPVLPITDAGRALIESLPITGPIIIFLIAGIVALAFLYVRREREMQTERDKKDAAIERAKNDHIATLEKVLPAMHDMKEAMTDLKETVLLSRRRT